jgi:hypothetical protein
MTSEKNRMRPMMIKGTPYHHQIEAFDFVCSLFGLKGGDDPFSIRSCGAALLMEM